MGSRRCPSFSSFVSHLVIFLVVILLPFAHSSGVFKVQRKFNEHHSIADLKDHDSQRHVRMLGSSSVDLNLGGNGLPTVVGLYYTELEIGTPARKFTVQVDTGSDILWVSCAHCDGCPENSSIGIELSTYDPEASNSSKKIDCEDKLCQVLVQKEHPKCDLEHLCGFQAVYGDGSSSTGIFVTDLINYNEVSGDHQTRRGSGNVTFGCTRTQTGASSVGMEGLIGFGQAKSSVISQLAAAGKVKNAFSHCLDVRRGGGIFAIGRVVEPIVKTTPLVPNMTHYNMNLKAVEVGSNILPIPKRLFENRENAGAILDSGTTLAYLPEIAYQLLVDRIFFANPNLKFENLGGAQCFEYDGSVDEGFPVVTFHFENSLALQVNPRDYFFLNRDRWCIGWQNGRDKLGFLLGDLVLSNKLVVYDLENQTVGWTNYDCTSSIKVEDETGKAAYIIGSHSPSSAHRVEMGQFLALLPLTFLMYVLI